MFNGLNSFLKIKDLSLDIVLENKISNKNFVKMEGGMVFEGIDV